MSKIYKKGANPPGYVPTSWQGLVAKESQLGAFGTRDWLKSIKLHKYWPLVSHWSYSQMMSLTAENISYQTSLVGGSPMTLGAQGKFLRTLQQLRERQDKLMFAAQCLQSDVSVSEALDYIADVVFTPMPTSPENPLPIVLVSAFFPVMELIVREKLSVEDQTTVKKIIAAIKANPVLDRAAARFRKMQKQINYLKRYRLLTSTPVENEKITSEDKVTQNNLNSSMDSGFIEAKPKVSYSWIQDDNLNTIWPNGSNAVMFDIRPIGTRPPLYQRAVETAEDSLDSEIKEMGEYLFRNLNL